MAFELPALAYGFSALEPHIDAKTMEIHHGKHHAAYVANANAALEGTEWAEKDVEEILKNLDAIPDAKRTAVRNNAGGHFNHSLFWSVMSPDGGGEPTGELANAINDAFGSFEGFKETFTKAAMTRFGSGWAWLGLSAEGGGKVCVCSTPNQDNPLMKGVDTGGCGCTPIMGIDVWEHAYYLNYQNRRPDYIAAFWNVVNWGQVAENYKNAMGG